jgi:hypothetical protein
VIREIFRTVVLIGVWILQGNMLGIEMIFGSVRGAGVSDAFQIRGAAKVHVFSTS